MLKPSTYTCSLLTAYLEQSARFTEREGGVGLQTNIRPQAEALYLVAPRERGSWYAVGHGWDRARVTALRDPELSRRDTTQLPPRNSSARY
jgi:hypothetical protein